MKTKYKKFDITNKIYLPNDRTFTIYCNSKNELKIHNGDNIIIKPQKDEIGYRVTGIKNIRYEKSNIGMYEYRLEFEYELSEFTPEDFGVFKFKISFIKFLNFLDKFFNIYEKP